MKVLAGLAAVCMMAALMGCQLGVSEEAVHRIVATAVAESEARMTEETETMTTDVVADALVDSEKRTETALEVAVAELTAADELNMTAMGVHVGNTVRAVCWSDYTTTVIYTAFHWLLDFIEGGEATFEHVKEAFDGLVVDETWGEYSGVCGREGGYWTFLELPDEVAN